MGVMLGDVLLLSSLLVTQLRLCVSVTNTRVCVFLNLSADKLLESLCSTQSKL